jgi:transcriptional regulator with XRE-family HTH domain
VSTHGAHIRRTIGANILRERQRRGLTQRQLGDALGVDTMQISRWERGAHRPSAMHETRLAVLLFDGNHAALYRDGDANGDDDTAAEAVA